ncbi:hypothetical protein BH10PSE17_BH10PSE17_09420 [soil metagenome]
MELADARVPAQDVNPFEPPASEVADPVTGPLALPIAGRGRRFGTFVVDYLCFLAAATMLGVTLGLAFGQPAIDVLDKIPNIVVGVPLLLAYYCFFEGIWSRTPGKWIFGTKVFTDTGERPSLARIAKRTLCRFIPFEALTFFGKQGLHDSISKTMVMTVRAPRR